MSNLKPSPKRGRSIVFNKTFKSLIEYTEKGQETEMIDGLFKTYIQRATEEIGAEWCVSVFTDNAGIIEFDDNYNIVFKVETHNHPSAIEPYGGAGTGIGGVIRDLARYGAWRKAYSEHGCILLSASPI